MELDATIWSGLPFEMVERVLSSLPVPDLCRYCSVCKTWNRLIRSPKFGALRAQSSAKRDASFIAMRCVLGQSEGTHEGWCFLDLEARRWYTVKDDHPKLPKPLLGCSVAVMDGGLVCRYLKPLTIGYQPVVPFNDTNAMRFSIIVYNPISKTLKELPSVPGHLKSTSYPELNLVVDNVSQRFRIFLINQHVCASLAASLKIQNDPLMRIFDSATNEWQGSANPFCISSRGVGSVSSTVVFQGFLYALFGTCRGYIEGHCETIEQEIWRYYIGENVWEKVNVDIAATLCSIMLFVSANRLFRMGWLFDKSRRGDLEQWRLEVYEIKTPGMVLERLFEMSKGNAVDLFGVKSSLRNPEIVASGFGNSILLTCKSSQKIMVLDLESRMWDRLPANPEWTHPGDEYYYNFESYFANPISHMNVFLPSSLWWQEGEGAADEAQVLLLKKATTLSYPEVIVID